MPELASSTGTLLRASFAWTDAVEMVEPRGRKGHRRTELATPTGRLVALGPRPARNESCGRVARGGLGWPRRGWSRRVSTVLMDWHVDAAAGPERAHAHGMSSKAAPARSPHPGMGLAQTIGLSRGDRNPSRHNGTRPCRSDPPEEIETHLDTWGLAHADRTQPRRSKPISTHGASPMAIGLSRGDRNPSRHMGPR